MEKIEVEITESVIDYLNELITRLFYRDYFSYKIIAQSYVQNIYDFIEHKLPYLPSKHTPKRLDKYGSYYLFYKANNRTTWYIFFEKLDHRFLITHITNNHIQDISFLNTD